MKKLILLVLLINFTFAWYFPGAAPQDYASGQQVELKVNKMTSVHTQLPYKYYSLPFCKPENPVKDPENLGEFLRGDIVENSVYDLRMDQKLECQPLCDKKSYTKTDINLFAKRIHYQYKIHWLLDNLPAQL